MAVITGSFNSLVSGTISGVFQNTAGGVLSGVIGTPGPQGIPGTPGAPGAPGQGVPVGGSAGQALVKIDGTNYNTEWSSLPAFLTKAGNLSGLTDFEEAQDNLGLGHGNEVTFLALTTINGVSFNSLEASGLTVSTNAGQPSESQILVSSTGIQFPDSTIQTTAFPGASGFAPIYSPVFTGNPRAPTPATNDNDTSIATTAFVKAQGYITSAPVTSVAGRTGAVTLANTDISGLGSLAVINDAPSDGSQYARQDGAWSVVSGGGTYLPLAGGTMDTGAAILIPYIGESPVADVEIRLGQTVGGSASRIQVASTSEPYSKSVLEFNAVTVQTEDGSIQIRPDVIEFTGFGAPVYLDAETIRGFAPKASPVFTGNPTAPTPATSDNDTSIATTAYVKAQAFGDRYLTTSTTSNTVSNGNKTFTIGTGLSYTPTQNITISYNAANHMHGEVLTYNSGTGVLTVDIKNHTGSGTYAAWVVNVGGVTPATSVAWGAITGTLSTQTDLQNALDLKANLASPTFTGTPTLPTGTIGVTQSPGNNTTALATTAFVTAAVPAFATNAQLIASSSTTTVLTPKDYRLAGLTTNIWAPGYVNLAAGTSGTGSTTGASSFTLSGTLTSPNASTAGYATRGFLLHYPSNAGTTSYNFGTASGHAMRLYSASLGSTIAGVKARAVFGRTNVLISAASTLAVRGYGWEWDFSTRTMNIIAHNGTTLTTTAVTWNPSGFRTYEVSVTSDGAGTISLYVDGTLLGTSSGGPTGLVNVASNFLWWQAEVQNEVTAGSQVSIQLTNPKVYTTNG